MDDASYEHLIVKRDGDIDDVTLDRPEKRNALALDVMEELTATLEAIGRTDALGVVLAANGPVFSAGHNFGDMAGADLRRGPPRLRRVHPDDDDGPVDPPAGVRQGARPGHRRRLPARGDVRPRRRRRVGRLRHPGGKGGLFCHTPLVAVARNIGRKRALEMAFTGDAIDAATAADWGLINRAVPDDELDAAVDDLMRRAIRGSAARPRPSASGRSTPRSTSTRPRPTSTPSR